MQAVPAADWLPGCWFWCWCWCWYWCCYCCCCWLLHVLTEVLLHRLVCCTPEETLLVQTAPWLHWRRQQRCGSHMQLHCFLVRQPRMVKIRGLGCRVLTRSPAPYINRKNVITSVLAELPDGGAYVLPCVSTACYMPRPPTPALNTIAERKGEVSRHDCCAENKDWSSASERALLFNLVGAPIYLRCSDFKPDRIEQTWRRWRIAGLLWNALAWNFR